jgi:arsenite methyltransferase
MTVQQEFDEWATSGKDRGMEKRHWSTAKRALARMPVEDGDRVLDLGTGSGYALRALRETQDAGYSVGLDGSIEMVRNARGYTNSDLIEYVGGDFHNLPFENNSVDHVWSMEAFYYADKPAQVIDEIRRILRSGGTFYCAVNYYEENVHSHGWQDNISIEMTRWSASEYRAAFRDAGLVVAEQDNIPDRETEIPPADAFPTEEWDSREAMVERYRQYGTLLTVGVAPAE